MKGFIKGIFTQTDDYHRVASFNKNIVPCILLKNKSKTLIGTSLNG